MNRARAPAVYRVCATAPDRWEVFHDPSGESVAAFKDKNAALSYALCLARGKTDWQLLMAGRSYPPRNGFGCASRAHHAIRYQRS